VRIESIRFNKDGQIRNEAKYEDGEVSYRTFYIYHDNGKLEMKGNELPRINGLTFDGIITNWYKSGQKEHESSYSKGKLVGKNSTWYENGQLSGEYFYGVDDFINRYWYKNGQLLGEYTNENGISTSMKEWHDNGQLERDWIYINGKKEGEYIKLDRDGKVSYKAIYKNDKCISGDCN
jgi:antitoxin component YwqK of YwqJK toxin-antitoxin module